MQGTHGEKSDHNFRFRIRGWMEQIDNRDPKPAGSLAALVVKGLDLGTGSPQARKKRVFSQWPKVARAFAPRIRRALGRGKLSREIVQKYPFAFFTFFTLVDFLHSAVLRKIGTGEGASDARRRCIEAIRRMHRQAVPTGKTHNGVEFVAPLEGLLLLSAFFGLTTGSLHPCPRCWGFYTVKWMKHRQKFCDACRREKPRISARGLSIEKSLPWRQVNHRVRTLFHRYPQRKNLRRRIPFVEEYLHERTPREAYRRWREQALPALLRTTDLEAWESQWAPPMQVGRPSKQAGAV